MDSIVADWESFPDELWLYIFQFVPKENINTTRTVCKRWRMFSQDKFTFGRRLNENVVVLGPQGSGKSTLLGQLLTQTEQISRKDQRAVDQYIAEFGTQSQKFALIVDKLKDEREQQASVDIHRIELEFPHTKISLIDTPGRVKYTKSAICGTTQADHALFVVNADLVQYPQYVIQLEDQIILCKISGIKSIIVAINKMDKATPVEYQQVQDLMNPLFKMRKYNDIRYIPISAFSNENLTTTNAYTWYDGPCLCDALQELPIPNRELHKPLRVCIDRAYSITGAGTVVTGTVIQGVIYVGQDIKIGPVGIVTRVKSLHLAIPKVSTHIAYAGDYIGLLLRDVAKKDCGARKLGLITSCVSETEAKRISDLKAMDYSTRWKHLKSISEEQKTIENKMRQLEAPLFPCDTFTAKVLMCAPKGKIKPGYQSIMHCHNAQVPVTIVQIKEIEKRRVGDLEEKNELFKWDIAIVEFRPQTGKLGIDLHRRCQKLGKFVLREGYGIIGAGLVVDTTVKDYFG